MALRVRWRPVLIASGRRGLVNASLAAAVLAVLLPLTSFLVAAWLLGWQLQTVMSGSMSPTYPVGSFLVIGQIDAADVRTGMAVVFIDPRDPGRYVTHRVVGQSVGDDLRFWTQGDANANRDPDPVPARLIRGRVLWAVPHLGTLMGWLRWPWSFVFLVALPGAFLAASELRQRQRLIDAEGRA